MDLTQLKNLWVIVMKQGAVAERVAHDAGFCAIGNESEREGGDDTPAMLNHKRLSR